MKSNHHDTHARNLIGFAILALAVSIAATGCTSNKSTNPYGGGTVGTNQGPTTWQVSASGMSFSPASLAIHVGDAVKWTAAGTHTVTSGTSASDAQAGSLFDQHLTNGQTFTHVFNAAGVYNYFCRFHGPMGMTGTITVTASPY
jgi:plastocyanin